MGVRALPHLHPVARAVFIYSQTTACIFSPHEFEPLWLIAAAACPCRALVRPPNLVINRACACPALVRPLCRRPLRSKAMPMAVELMVSWLCKLIIAHTTAIVAFPRFAR